MKSQVKSRQKQYQTLKTRYGRVNNAGNAAPKSGPNHHKKSSTKISAQAASKSIKNFHNIKKSISRESSKDSRKKKFPKQSKFSGSNNNMLKAQLAHGIPLNMTVGHGDPTDRSFTLVSQNMSGYTIQAPSAGSIVN